MIPREIRSSAAEKAWRGRQHGNERFVHRGYSTVDVATRRSRDVAALVGGAAARSSIWAACEARPTKHRGKRSHAFC